MESISLNAKNDNSVDSRAVKSQRGPRSSDKRCLRVAVLCLSLLNALLWFGLIYLGYHYQNTAAELATVKADLSECLQTSDYSISSPTEEKDLLNGRNTEMTEELERLQSLVISGNKTLSECVQTLAKERDLTNARETEMTEELERLQSLDQNTAAELATVKADLSECLQTSDSSISSSTEEKDLLNGRNTEMTEELERHKNLPLSWIQTLFEGLQTLAKERNLTNAGENEMTEELEGQKKNLCEQGKTCPIGWRMFNCSCYLPSSESGTWDEGRTDCRNRGADLVVIDSHEEQVFLSAILSELTNKHAWIGLSDREKEGTWEWIDGSPTSKGPTYWEKDQPDNGGGDPRFPDEDCAYMYTSSRYTLWNDRPCENSWGWICEKAA
ncbi:uncharacterized protein ABDE67_020502 [Symphorus nematophorus]